VQAAREAARRMQCSNHFKQWTLAIHSYHDTYFSLPAGAAKKNTSDAYRVGPTFAILPFMEQQARSASILGDPHVIPENGSYSNTWMLLGDTIEAIGQPIATLLCPSDGDARQPSPQYSCGRNNIMYCYGDLVWPPDYFLPNYGSAYEDRTLFHQDLWKGMESCSDGTSNTVVASESITQSQDYETDIRRDLLLVDNNTWTPNACYAFTAGITTFDGSSSNIGTSCARIWRGSFFAYSTAFSSGFCTVLPPNRLGCWSQGGIDMIPPTSYHPGGVTCGKLDGSVSFVSDTIDCGNPASQDGAAIGGGPSPYGVWGAVGTPNGGEAKSL